MQGLSGCSCGSGEAFDRTSAEYDLERFMISLNLPDTFHPLVHLYLFVIPLIRSWPRESKNSPGTIRRWSVWIRFGPAVDWMAGHVVPHGSFPAAWSTAGIHAVLKYLPLRTGGGLVESPQTARGARPLRS